MKSKMFANTRAAKFRAKAAAFILESIGGLMLAGALFVLLMLAAYAAD